MVDERTVEGIVTVARAAVVSRATSVALGGIIIAPVIARTTKVDDSESTGRCEGSHCDEGKICDIQDSLREEWETIL